MKKIIVTLFVVFSFNFCEAQPPYVTIPDPYFAAWLDANYPTCMWGNKMDTSCWDIFDATYINCSVSNISDLTGIEYFVNILSLDCSDNYLTSLPPLPKSITQLYCSYNQLTSLPALPDSLTELSCYYNNLTSLPTLPKTLLMLDCNTNQLTGLPNLSASLLWLECSFNQLSALPNLPSSLYYFRVIENAELKCMPPLDTFIGDDTMFFEISGTKIKCLPNKIEHPKIANVPAIDNIPICDSKYNPNNCTISACNAHFTLYPDVVTPQHWYALNQAKGKSPINYSWSWGDGSSNSTGATPSHTYSSAGYYKICLTISDDTTCSSTYCDSSTYINRMEEENAIISVDVVNSIPTEVRPDIGENNYVIISPNPATDYLNITTSYSSTITISNILGQQMKYQDASIKYQDKKQIDVSDFPNGIYFLHAQSGNDWQTLKFIVQH